MSKFCGDELFEEDDTGAEYVLAMCMLPEGHEGRHSTATSPVFMSWDR